MSFHSSKTRCNTQVGSIHRTSPVRPVAALVSAGIALFAIAFQPIQVQAGFYSSASIELHLYGPTPTDYYQTAYNSTDLSGVKLVQTIADPFALASGFMQVSPQVDGVTFRASAKSVEVFSGDGRYAVASVQAYWSDVLHFTPISDQAANISSFRVLLDLSGTMSVTPSRPDATTQAEFGAHWGAGSGQLEPRLFSEGEYKYLSIDHQTLQVDSGGVDVFSPSGVQLLVNFHVVAATDPVRGTDEANFGHTGEILGLLAYDSAGNLLPDAAQWASVTSDSGVAYKILSGIPAAVPEPSSLVLLACGATVFLTLARIRKSRERRYGIISPREEGRSR